MRSGGKERLEGVQEGKTVIKIRQVKKEKGIIFNKRKKTRSENGCIGIKFLCGHPSVFVLPYL